MNATDLTGKTPLHYAAARGHVRVVQVLIEARADLSCKDLAGHTPAEVASLAGHDECCLAMSAGRRVAQTTRHRDTSNWTVAECVEWAREQGLGENVCSALQVLLLFFVNCHLFFNFNFNFFFFLLFRPMMFLATYCSSLMKMFCVMNWEFQAGERARKLLLPLHA